MEKNINDLFSLKNKCHTCPRIIDKLLSSYIQKDYLKSLINKIESCDKQHLQKMNLSFQNEIKKIEAGDYDKNFEKGRQLLEYDKYKQAANDYCNGLVNKDKKFKNHVFALCITLTRKGGEERKDHEVHKLLKNKIQYDQQETTNKAVKKFTCEIYKEKIPFFDTYCDDACRKEKEQVLDHLNKINNLVLKQIQQLTEIQSDKNFLSLMRSR